MADSDSSALSSAPTTDDEAMELKMSKATGLDRYFKPAPKKKEASPEPPRREPSPPHEYTLADNDAIAFLVMFRSRFSDAFPKSLPHYGPQDLERGVSDTLPDEGVERYLCALLSLVLNRKKDVEYGHDSTVLRMTLTSVQEGTLWQGTRGCYFVKHAAMARCMAGPEPTAWGEILQYDERRRKGMQLSIWQMRD